MPEKVQHDLMEQSKIGEQLFESFVTERIQSGKVNLWARMKKKKQQKRSTKKKQQKRSSTSQIVELRKDRNLFARN